MVISEFFISKPDEMEATLIVRMTVREWKLLAEQLPSKHPSNDLDRHIREIIKAADRHFYQNNPYCDDAEAG